jgi:hypothetical protein
MKKWPRRLFAKLRIVAGDPVPPEAATPEKLHAAVLALRGAWL